MITLEAAADYNLWIWYYSFGLPGALNDINIWEQSPLLQSFINGSFERLDFPFKLNGENFSRLFFLVDGIYPPLARFVQTILVPLTRIDGCFSRWQEAKRKDIERAFGVLQRKFHCLTRPFEKWDLDEISAMVSSCIILHNMMVSERIERNETETDNHYECVGAEADSQSEASSSGAAAHVEAEETALAAAIERNPGIVDIDSDAFDAADRADYDRIQLLPLSIRIAEERWSRLTDREAHYKLQAAVKAHVYKASRGSLAGAEDPEDYNLIVARRGL